MRECESKITTVSINLKNYVYESWSRGNIFELPAVEWYKHKSSIRNKIYNHFSVFFNDKDNSDGNLISSLLQKN